jgi:hypothetical protein
VIEVGEIDARREHVPAAIFAVLDHVAAQHRDVALRIERREVDRGFLIGNRAGVLGVEEAPVAHGHIGGLAAPLDRGAFEIDPAAFEKARQQLERLRPRQQHGVAQMRAGGGTVEYVREQNALVDLDAVLVALDERAFATHLLAGRHQPGHFARGGVNEIGDAQEGGQVFGERAVERLGVRLEEGIARRAVGALDERSGARLRGVAHRLLRQDGKKRAALLPVLAERRDVAAIVAARGRPLVPPGRGRLARQQRGQQCGIGLI